MPITVPSTSAGVPVGPAKRRRFGTIAARIATQHPHRTGIPTQYGPAGVVIHLVVQDVTRHPAEARAARWHCRHPFCTHKHPGGFESKEALLESHPDNRVLDKQEETHLYLAVFEAEATPAVPEKRDEKSGKVLQPAVDAKPARVLLLSDEE